MFICNYGEMQITSKIYLFLVFTSNQGIICDMRSDSAVKVCSFKNNKEFLFYYPMFIQNAISS